MDAAILSSWNTGDTELQTKVDQLVAKWLTTQQPDGYLGTYDEVDRWKSWDIWVQAHDIIGLVSYYHRTGKPEVLAAAVKIADRVMVDFGRGKRGVRETGPHVGMASSAILEPMIWLYWETGNQAYLDFGRWLVDEDWEAENGPKIVSTILKGKGVAECGNSKGIEMLIDFAGLLELYRATGEQRYLQTLEMAWQDIVSHHLYITGSASTGEFFPKDFVLRNEGVYQIGETCVSMGWMYLNLSLARLSGDAKYYDMVEQTLYNHLLAAQSPDGQHWAYYMGLRDSKRYRWHTDPECCPSRGVRAIAQLPTHTFTVFDEGIEVNLFDTSSARLPLKNGEFAEFEMKTEYPYDGKIHLQIKLAKPQEFTIRLRLPGWVQNYELQVNGKQEKSSVIEKGYIKLRQNWQDNDVIELSLDMPIRVVVDTLGNAGRVAFMRGPIVFAADQAYLPEKLLLDEVTVLLDRKDPEKAIKVTRSTDGVSRLVVKQVQHKSFVTDEVWREKERYKSLVGENSDVDSVDFELVPFLEAGTKDARNFKQGIQPNSEPVTHITYQVWLPFDFVD